MHPSELMLWMWLLTRCSLVMSDINETYDSLSMDDQLEVPESVNAEVQSALLRHERGGNHIHRCIHTNAHECTGAYTHNAHICITVLVLRLSAQCKSRTYIDACACSHSHTHTHEYS